MPTPSNSFVFYGVSHWAALLTLGICLLVMIGIARKCKPSNRRVAEKILAIVLLLQWPIQVLFYWQQGRLDVDRAFPLHLCDVVGFLSAMLLWTDKLAWAPYVYFLGMAGTFQGLLTPALTEDYPSLRYFVFFISHGGVVLTALYSILGKGWSPLAIDKWKAWAGLNVFALVVGLFNALMGANYGFLCRKPATASLFDALGPWPWYIFAASCLAFVLFLVLDLPFMIKRRKL